MTARALAEAWPKSPPGATITAAAALEAAATLITAALAAVTLAAAIPAVRTIGSTLVRASVVHAEASGFARDLEPAEASTISSLMVATRDQRMSCAVIPSISLGENLRTATSL